MSDFCSVPIFDSPSAGLDCSNSINGAGKEQPVVCGFLPDRLECKEWCFCNPPEPNCERDGDIDPRCVVEPVDPCVENPEADGCRPDVPDNNGNGPNENSNAGDGEGKGKDESGKGMMDMKDAEWIMAADPMTGQITYTMVAIMSASMIALDMFRYNPSSTYYAEWANAFAAPGTNYWQYANEAVRYTSLAFWVIASLSQLLSIAGVLGADINMMIWMNGGAATALVGLISHILYMVAYDTVFTAYSQDNAGADATIQGYIDAATTIKDTMELDAVAMAAHDTIVMATLYEQGMNWMAAQMMMMGDEKKEEVMEEMKDEDGEVPEELLKIAFNYMF